MLFFLDKLPNILKPSIEKKDFFNLFFLYVDGVLSQQEFFKLVDDLLQPNFEDHKKQLQSMVSQRDNARRLNNNLLRPISEMDVKQFKSTDNVTPSYYKLPVDYPLPVCSGRFQSDIAMETLNDKYCSFTSGSENFKFKQKNANEEALFKNEDEMYATDHKII